jgi:alpha-L-fucosidase 2
MTYRPFTLEGNFAFAAAVQEMLLQSHAEIVRVFPAVPEGWRDASFDSLRTYGAFLVSAKKKDGKVVEIRVTSEKGGKLRLENPFPGGAYRASGLAADAVSDAGPVIQADMRPGEQLLLKPAHIPG